MQRSCNGETLPNCRARAVSAVGNPTVSPQSISRGDLAASLHLSATLAVCAGTLPGTPHVHVDAVGGPSGMESSEPVADLYDDGNAGDATAGDGVYERDVVNPFFGTWPLGTTTLTFTGVIDTCRAIGPGTSITILQPADGGGG